MLNFDIKAYLDSKNIRYDEKGKNVTKGWINLCCILPSCSDHSNHLGINLKSLIYKCWLCGQKGPVTNLIKIIENCSEGVAKQIIKRFPIDETDSIWDEEQEPIKNTNLILPPEIEKEWPQIHLNYLKSRNFDPETLIKKYQLMPVWTIGKYRFRIIIPIFINHQMVSFTSMDILRQDDRPKYMDCPIPESIIPVKHCLYGIDNVKDKVVVYEGVTGCWNFGDGSVASFTSNFSQEQILLFVKKKIKKAFIIFDENAQQKGEKMAIQLSGIIPSVEQICFKSIDPKDIDHNEIIALKKDLGFI
jgi:hypothetical protein